MTAYTVDFQNNGTNSGWACVYQTDPGLQEQIPNILSVAWFSKYAYPTSAVEFSWSVDYDAVWGETGILKPGITFVASEHWVTDLSTNNQISLSYDQANSAYHFGSQTQGSPSGCLIILEDNSVPLNLASVGLSVDNKASFVVQAQPNQKLTFQPDPLYWIVFGSAFKQGTVLEVQVSGAGLLDFGKYNVTTLSATLNQNNTWSIAPTS